MKVSFTQPEKQLSPYVAFIWVFESSFGVPLADSRIIVPDGRAKYGLKEGLSLSEDKFVAAW